jgi:TonB family protein
MTFHSGLIRLGGLTAIMVLGLSSVVRGQQAELAAARDLYASAAYEEALNLLNQLRSSNTAAARSPAVEQYRAFCRNALGRPEDAERAIEAVVAAEPGYQPSESDVSPRVRAAFTEVRRRMLPSIIQRRYAEAKAAYDNKMWADAARAFREVLTSLGDPDVAESANRPPLSDLRTLAAGFEELSAKAAAPPPPPPVVAAPPVPAPPVIYTVNDTGVVAPAILNQAMPAFPERVVIPRNGKIEVVIDENGMVESAVMTDSVTNMYDAMVLEAARRWRYRPATFNGVPVKYRKAVTIALRPATPS